MSYSSLKCSIFIFLLLLSHRSCNVKSTVLIFFILSSTKKVNCPWNPTTFLSLLYVVRAHNHSSIEFISFCPRRISILSLVRVTCDNLSRCGAPRCPHMYDANCLFRWAAPEGTAQAETHLLYNPKATEWGVSSLCVNMHLHMPPSSTLQHTHRHPAPSCLHPQPTFTSAFMFSSLFLLCLFLLFPVTLP